MNNLAMAYQATGQLNKALPLLEETLAKTKAKLGPDHPETLISMGNLAGAYLAAKEPEKALPLLRSFLAGQKKQLGGANPRLAGLQAAVALALLKAGQPAAAEPVLRDCLAICEKKLPDSWLTFNTQSMLGGALLGQKKYKEAEPLLLKGYEGMKERQARTPGANAPGSPFQQRLTEAIERLVQLYDATGQAEQAARWRKERERVMGREKKDAR
jgi:tetratricopeptide (TPR) repeat protein